VDPLNADLAWNVFATAEHLPDRIYYQDMPTSGKTMPDLLDGKERRPFKQAYLWTRICSHLADGGKHFHLDDSNLNSVASTRQQGGWVPLGWVPPGWVELPALMVDLTPDEQRDLPSPSASIEALILAAKVLEFWRNVPVLQSPTEAPAP
jgi:hypothetical protein